MKKNFKVAAILFVLAGVLMGVAAITFSGHAERLMFKTLSIAFLISAVLQVILFRRQRSLFKDRPTHPE
jgi:uncharacterized membrane protein HdeD (DUF308 family)